MVTQSDKLDIRSTHVIQHTKVWRSKFSSMAAFCVAPFVELNALIASLLGWEGKQGIKSKEGAIKCFKERKINSPTNEWCNIPL